MKETKLRLPYGRRHISVSIPSERLLEVLIPGGSREISGKDGIRRFLGASFRNAVSDAACGHRRLALVVPDSTRKAHLKHILPVVLNALPRRCEARIIAATGLHAPHTRPELRALLGARAFDRCAVSTHSQEKERLIDLGATRSGVPVVMNKELAECDGVMAFGVIEPHLYAGYSGGVKSVSIGLAGEETINRTHHPSFLDDPRVSIGTVSGNPFQETLWAIALNFNIIFSVNAVNNAEGMALGIFYGAPGAVFSEGVKFARLVYEARAAQKADIVICAVGYPKDINLYQASRALNYILDVERPVIKDGGFIIVLAEMADGLGSGMGEKRCFEALKRMGKSAGGVLEGLPAREDILKFIAEIKSGGCPGGEHRAYMIARAMLRARAIFVGRKAPGLTRGLPLLGFGTVSEALGYADRMLGPGAGITVIPRALATIAETGKVR